VFSQKSLQGNGAQKSEHQRPVAQRSGIRRRSQKRREAKCGADDERQQEQAKGDTAFGAMLAQGLLESGNAFVLG
jgi:hypothetical protein